MAKKNNEDTPVIIQNNQVEQTQAKPLTAKEFFEGPAIKKRFEDLLGKNAPSFITSILQIVTNDKLLAEADPYSIYNSACTAAVMKLSINPNLGQACIIGFKDSSKGGKVFAQFQIMWKGLVQLAQRTNEYKTIHATEVYNNQFESYNYMTGELKMKNIAPDTKTGIAGFVSYFSLLSGFEKTFFMTKDEMNLHAQRYSKSYRAGHGQWVIKNGDENGYIGMGKKTVLKLNLDKFGPKSIEMQKAIQFDQAIINDDQGTSFNYPDNQPDPEKNHEEDRIKKMIEDANTIDELAPLLEHCTTPELEGIYTQRKMNIQQLAQ